jgi:secretion/DNA translocation related TadE-like protein
MSGGVSERGLAAGRCVAARSGGRRFAEASARAAGLRFTDALARAAGLRFVGAGLAAVRFGRARCAKVGVGSVKVGVAKPRLSEAGPANARFPTAGFVSALFTNVRRSAARCARAHVGAMRSDRGSATVWSVGAIAVLCVVFGAVLALGQAVVVRHRAAGGADLAALAAADHWADGPVVACARAEDVAREQGVRLVRCAMVGEISDVTAASGRGPFTAEIRARAGPAGPVPSEDPLPPAPDGSAGTPPGAGGPVPPVEPAAPGTQVAGPRGAPPPAPPATAP